MDNNILAKKIRRTKIVATLGPASNSPEVLEQLVLAGVNLVRINMSHGTHADHAARIEHIRAVSKKFKIEVAILVDLQGPKIRVAKFINGAINLNQGDQFILDAAYDTNSGTSEIVGIDYKELPKDVKTNDLLLLDDGKLEFRVNKVDGQRICCEVLNSGKLSNNKGINLKGGGLSAPALTEKDYIDLDFALEQEADYIAISFPKNGQDMQLARDMIKKANSESRLIAKIERLEAIEDQNLTDIINASDAVMVARGDLGVEIGFAELPAVQKQIIARARELNCAIITATQMMESMIENSIPTRAEVSDVANSIIDGTDAVMLSAETAAGSYPVETVKAMASICVAAEKQKIVQEPNYHQHRKFSQVDEAIAMAAMFSSNHLDVKAIVSLTETGSTPIWMSRIRSGLPIYGISRHSQTCRRLTLYRGVYPILFNYSQFNTAEVIEAVIEVMKSKGQVQANDKIVLTKGDTIGVSGLTNMLKIITVN